MARFDRKTIDALQEREIARLGRILTEEIERYGELLGTAFFDFAFGPDKGSESKRKALAMVIFSLWEEGNQIAVTDTFDILLRLPSIIIAPIARKADDTAVRFAKF